MTDPPGPTRRPGQSMPTPPRADPAERAAASCPAPPVHQEEVDTVTMALVGVVAEPPDSTVVVVEIREGEMVLFQRDDALARHGGYPGGDDTATWFDLTDSWRDPLFWREVLTGVTAVYGLTLLPGQQAS